MIFDSVYRTERDDKVAVMSNEYAYKKVIIRIRTLFQDMSVITNYPYDSHTHYIVRKNWNGSVY